MICVPHNGSRQRSGFRIANVAYPFGRTENGMARSGREEFMPNSSPRREVGEWLPGPAQEQLGMR